MTLSCHHAVGRRDVVPVWICIQSACVTLGIQNKAGEETSITAGKIFYRATLRPPQRRNLVEGSSLNLVIYTYAVLGNAIMPFRCISTITFQWVSPAWIWKMQHLDGTSASAAAAVFSVSPLTVNYKRKTLNAYPSMTRLGLYWWMCGPFISINETMKQILVDLLPLLFSSKPEQQKACRASM